MIRYIVAGHFGSTLSYATITKEISSALARWKMLAGTINFDDKYVGFDPVKVSQEDMSSARLLCVSLPSHHVEQLADYMGRDRCILYMSPNTDDLSEEARRASWSFGGILTPSLFCETTVLRTTGRVSGRVPLGVSHEFFREFKPTADALADRLGQPPRILHMSTDGFLPGRKGTDALLDGIVDARPRLPKGTRFTFHVMPRVQFDVRTACIDRNLQDIVEVAASEARGVSDLELIKLIGSHDLVVQPSRCEGFGITQLLALVLGVPLVTTHATGMSDFLPSFRGCWMPVRHCAMGRLEGEGGLAPMVSGGEMAEVLALAASTTMRKSMLEYQAKLPKEMRFQWLWSECSDRWIDAMEDSLQHG